MPEDRPRPAMGEGDEAWMGGMAEGLWRASRREGMESSPVTEAVRPFLGPERSVLDIGAGVGRFAVPLAREGVRVEAVEPSATMREYLRRHIEEAGVGERVRVIPEAWPTVSAGVAEVALAAFVVHFAADPLDFVRAMERHATRRVVVVVHVDAPFGRWRDLLAPLLPLDRPRRAGPSFKQLLPALVVADIVPEVRVFEQVMGPRWSSPQEAEAALTRRFHVDDPVQRETLSRILQDHPESWRSPSPVRAAILSWEPGRRTTVD